MYYDELFLDVTKLPKPLSETELYECFKQYSFGNNDMKEKIITHNISLVIYEVLEKFKNFDYDKKELISVGIIGLIKSVNYFDVTKNVKFATFAIRCIDNEILMFIRKTKRTLICNSIDEAIYESENGDLIKLEDILCDQSVDIGLKYEIQETKREVLELLNVLKHREKEMVMLYFGFYDDVRYSQKEIAEMFNLTQSYVSRCIIKSLNKLKKEMLNKNNSKVISLNI